MDMIFTIGIFTSLFFCILLINKKNKTLPDKILSLWMLMIGLHLTSTYLYSKGYWEVYPHLIGITAPLPLLYGPLLFLYVSYSLGNIKSINEKDYVHFIPVIASYLYMSRFYFFYSVEEKRLVDAGELDDFGIFSTFLVIGILLSAFSYALISFRLIRKHKVLLEDNFSNNEHINLNWLRGFILGVGFIFLAVALILIAKDIVGISFPFNPDFIFYTMIVFAVLSLGYFGIRHENIFSDNEIVVMEDGLKSSYKKSTLKEDMATKKHGDLKRIMAEQKPYLEPNLTLNSLAEQLDISIHHLSQIINQFEGQNFNEFINKYRVEEFIERASRDTHFSYLAIALDSGFNSKSTFNSVFRRHKGVTPSQYMASS